MKNRPFSPSRRSFITVGGALLAAGAGVWSWQSTDRSPLSELPAGSLLVVRSGRSDRERRLVARDSRSHDEREIEVGIDVAYQDAALSPDGRYLAVLKRMPRGSMPTDAVALYDWRSLRRLSETEVQIPFQNVPTYTIGWSADGTRLAVPYNNAGRTLLFAVRDGGQVGLTSMLRGARFRFHPRQSDLALEMRGSREIRLLQIADSTPERAVDTFAGADAEWSPDGSMIAYVAQRTGGRAALVIREERSRRTLAAIETKVQAHVWSPNSRRLAVYCSHVSDPLRLAGFVPHDIIPGRRLFVAEPRLLVYDTATRRTTSVVDLPQGFQLAHLQWLSSDWLLVVAFRSAMSFITDRRGESRYPVPALDDFTPLLTWLPARL
jgi:hypothetical protein